MIRVLLMTIAFIAVVVMNTLANTLPLNGQTTGEVSNRLSVLFTPASYVFSIWGIIYLLLGVWIIAFWVRLRKGQTPSYTVALMFTLSCVFNISWLLLWHYEFFATSIVAMLGYLIALIVLYLQYNDSGRSITERMPIAINMGWISVATIANISFVLTYYNWSGWGLSDQLWTVIMLTIATALALHIRFHHMDIPFALVFIWAFIGIAIKHGTGEMLVTTASLFLSGVILTGILLIKKRTLVD